MKDGARLYSLDLNGFADYRTIDYADFSEVGRVVDADCSNHASYPADGGAFGNNCFAYQFLSHAQAIKLGKYYLYLTTGCTYTECDNDTGKCETGDRDGTVCDMDGTVDGTYTPTAIKVLINVDE